jgi:UDP-N-acetylmuramate dehydrogenase
MLGILRQRRAKFPRREPNCGSVFANSPELYKAFGPPGKVIDEASLKGTTCGGASVSERHANFIINTGTATAADVLDLITLIREKVHQKTQMWLECEVRYVSPDGVILRADQIKSKQ